MNAYYKAHRYKLLNRQKKYYRTYRNKILNQQKEYYWKNAKKLRPIIAARQRKYNEIKRGGPIILSNTPAAICVRNWRKEFIRKYKISPNQILRNGKNAFIAIKKARYKCQKCKSKSNLQIHHKDNKGRNLYNRGYNPNNKISNLMVLCRSCHSILHGKIRLKGGVRNVCNLRQRS